MRRVELLPLLVLAALLGCEDPAREVRSEAPAGDADDARPPRRDASDAGPDVAADVGRRWPEVQWRPCDPPLADPDAECTSMEVPLDWDRPDGPTLPLALARRRAATTPRGQLWLLNGGPGGPGTQLAFLLPRFAGALPDLDLYLPDHRGTGGSGRLGCGEAEAPESALGVAIGDAEWPTCAQEARSAYGGTLAQFTVTSAGRDVLALIEATRNAGDQVLLYGVSYGTLWADRILRLDEGTIDAAVLDSACPPGLCRADTYDAVFEAQAETFFAGCVDYPACGDRLGADPWARVVETFERVAGGHCAEALAGFGLSDLKKAFALAADQAQAREALPAIVHRLGRCNDDDVDAISHFLGVMKSYDPRFETPKVSSDLLGVHVMLSEMWGGDPRAANGSPVPPDRRTWEANNAARPVAPGFGAPLARLHDDWPAYPPDEHVGRWADTDRPVLILSGTLDHQTPPAFAHAAQRAYDNARLVLLPWAAHATIVQSPIGDGEHCGMLLTAAFLGAPNAPLDTTCSDQVLEPWYELAPIRSSALLGRLDPWGDIAR